MTKLYLAIRYPLLTGFTLIEVLVAIVVLAIGLLGIAGIQLSALKFNDSAYVRSQATFYSYEILDRMRANRNSAVAGNYNQALSAFSVLSQPGNNASIATTDRYDWYRKLDGALNSAKASISCTASAICTVTVQWDDSRAEEKDTPAVKSIVLAGQL